MAKVTCLVCVCVCVCVLGGGFQQPRFAPKPFENFFYIVWQQLSWNCTRQNKGFISKNGIIAYCDFWRVINFEYSTWSIVLRLETGKMDFTMIKLSGFLRRSLMIFFIILDFGTIFFIFIVIFIAFRLMCPPVFFRCFLSNSEAYTELWTISFI